MFGRLTSLLLTLIAVANAYTIACAAEPKDSSARLALETIFCPQRAPSQKSMGLVQRSFLDLVETSHDQLQVAIVIDGTDSMSADLEGVRSALKNMMSDLRRYRGDQVTFAVVVFRDSGAPSGEISIPLKNWSADPQVLSAALDLLKPETGAPYFLELPDLGVHDALDKLMWSSDEKASRWLILFGDAPPYDADFSEPETGARRRYDTDLLVSLAKRKQVQISCILSTSREEEREVYTQVVDKTRQFMNSLASGTGGVMLDLSYPDIRQTLVDTAKKERVEYQPIGRITREDVEAVRAAAETAKLQTAVSERIRLAILPHMPFKDMSFDPRHEAVQIATELRQQLRGVPRAEVKSPVEVERQLRRLKSEDTDESQLLQALSLRLRVDYVIWGTFRRNLGTVEVKSAIYSQQDGKKLVEAGVLSSDALKETELAGNLSNKLLLAAFKKQAPPKLVAAYAALRDKPNLIEGLIRPVAFTPESRNDLLVGFELLEQALSHSVGTPESQILLEQARPHLSKAVDLDPRNPLSHATLAQCLLNEAQYHVQKGDVEATKASMQQFTESLKRAYREKDTSQHDYVKQEINADYQLLIKKDVVEAIRLYESLTKVQDSGRLYSALRAHWMLAGIYSGDWGTPDSAVEADKAREHLIAILAHWPESSEAAFIRQHLRWDENKGRNEFEHFPRENSLLVSAGG